MQGGFSDSALGTGEAIHVSKQPPVRATTSGAGRAYGDKVAGGDEDYGVVKR